MCVSCIVHSGGHFAKYWGLGAKFQHVWLWCRFKICESFKYSAWYISMSNSLFDINCNVTIALYAYILVCFLVPLAPPKQHKL